MKIGVISDVHSNLYALKAVLEDLEKHKVEKIFNAGDNVGYSTFPNECIDLLIKKNVISAMGNYDDAVGNNRPFCGCGEGSEKTQALRLISLNWAKINTSIECKDYLKQLPKYPRMTISGKSILIMHGGLIALNQFIYKEENEKIEEIAANTDAEIILMGHTHLDFTVQKSGKLFVNPGSVGKPIDGNPDSSYAIIDAENFDTKFYRVKYDISANINALKSAGIAEEIIEDLKTGVPFSKNV